MLQNLRQDLRGRGSGDAVRPGQAHLSSAFRVAIVITLAVTASPLAGGPGLRAQGITTAAIRGSVRAADGTDVSGASATVVHTGTGFVSESEVRDGHFLVQGLRIGGPYTVIVRMFGFHPQRREGVFLALGDPLQLDFVMQPAAMPLEPLLVAADRLPRAHVHGGTATTLPDSMVHRLPTPNRDFHDFVRLVPQVSTKTGFRWGFSGGGVGLRFNRFLIDGVRESTLFANATASLADGRSLPLEAVEEYEVLLAPFDVRYGDFAGALVNTVTRSGTNRFEGSAFAYARDDRFARSSDLAPITPYERVQYGFSLGGPVVRDRLHFFVAPELQHFTWPAPGPYLGQPPSATPRVPVNETDVRRLDGIMRGYGLTAGSGGPVRNGTPLANLFARLDLAIPELNGRAVVWHNTSRSATHTLSRAAPDTFSLSTYQRTQRSDRHLTSVKLLMAVGRSGGRNELMVSRSSAWAVFTADERQPIVRVSVPSTSGGTVTLNTGTQEAAQGLYAREWTTQIEDNLSLPLGRSHVMTLGASVERFRIGGGGVPGSYGTWTFSSLDSLQRGVAEGFALRKDLGSPRVPIAGGQYAAYVGDRWQAGERVTITLGSRVDWLGIGGQAPYNPVVDSIFRRRTDRMPGSRLHLSPRLGFAWDLFGTGRDRIRGGLGIFTGHPPLAWYQSALSSYGVGIGSLRCGGLPNDRGPPPPFQPDYRLAPTACANGAGLSSGPLGDVDLLDRRLRMAQTLRVSLAYERRLPWDLLATAEALFTRSLVDFVFVNLNLESPQGVDHFGRVLYGTIGPTGMATPALKSGFSEVIELRNTSRNRSYQLSVRLEKRYSRGVGAIASYTFSHVRDVQTPLRTGVPGIVNWSGGRVVSGRHDDSSPGISLNDVPHRIVLAGTYTAPWERWPTTFSFYYVGESGSPFTYRAWGAAGRGDLNADGSNVNDPIYVPRDASDPKEIVFSGRSDMPGADNSPAAQAERARNQGAAFGRFIERTACLRQQRGGILERNSCREPWSHTTVLSVRQALHIAGRSLEGELDMFNVLHLVDGEWGLHRVADPQLLEHVGQTSESSGAPQPAFRFDPMRSEWTILGTESAFQLQFGLRYHF